MRLLCAVCILLVEWYWWDWLQWICRVGMDPGKLFIGGISWDTDEDRLREYFRNFGEVVEVMIMRDRTTGRARGFGFVVFADPVAAARVVLEKHVIDGRTVSLLYSTWFSLIFLPVLEALDVFEAMFRCVFWFNFVD